MDLAGKKYRILIVDDSEINRTILEEIFRTEYKVIEAGSVEAAVKLLQKSPNEISLVMFDVLMPGIDGYEVLECMNRYGIIEDVPVIMLSTETSTDFITKAYDLGAMDYVSRPFAAAVVQRRVKNTIALYAKQRRLVDTVAGQIYEKENNNRLMVSILSHIVEFRNGESGSHVVHINLITEMLLHQLVKKTDLQNNILGLDSRRELQNLTDEILNNDDLASLGQMLQQIEFERSKSEFFESELPEIFFSFQSNPPVLTVSESGAQKLGISRVISDALENDEATRRIYALSDPKKASVPIIVMTANAFEKDRKETMSVGMNEHIAKPLDFKQLSKTLNKWLGK